MNRLRSWIFPLVLAIILGGLSVWLGRVSELKFEEVKLPAHEPQYTGFGLSLKRFDASGQLKEQLDAVRTWQLPDKKDIFFEKPYLQVYDAGVPQYSVISDKARYELNSKKIFLEQRVMLNKAAQNGQLAGQVATEWLNIDTQTQVAQTDALVQYQYGQSHGTSVGMVYDNKQGVLNLTSKVRAKIYEVQ